MGTLEVWVLAVWLHPLGFWGILQRPPVWIDPAKAFIPPYPHPYLQPCPAVWLHGGKQADNQCFPVEQDGIAGPGGVAGLAVGFRGPRVLWCFVTRPTLCCIWAGGDITWGGYEGTVGVDVHLWGPDATVCGCWSGAACRRWNRHGGSQTWMFSPLVMPCCWGPTVCSVQPPKGSFPGCLLIQGTFRRSFRAPITPHGPPLSSSAEHCTWPLFSSHVLRGICTWPRGTEMSQHLSRHPVTSGLPAKFSCQDPVPQFPSCVALADRNVSASRWH